MPRDMNMANSRLRSSDIFYDDRSTLQFLKFLYGRFNKSEFLVMYLTVEKRVVFAIDTMSSISLGYDVFQQSICSHPNIRTKTVGKSHQYQCSACDRNQRYFVASPIPVISIPQVFQYVRMTTLELWRVDGIIVNENESIVDKKSAV